MNARGQRAGILPGLCILVFVAGLGLVLWRMLYGLGRPFLEGVLLISMVAVLELALGIRRGRASLGWGVLFASACSLLALSVMSPLGLGPFLGPLGLLALGGSLWWVVAPGR